MKLKFAVILLLTVSIFSCSKEKESQIPKKTHTADQPKSTPVKVNSGNGIQDEIPVGQNAPDDTLPIDSTIVDMDWVSEDSMNLFVFSSYSRMLVNNYDKTAKYGDNKIRDTLTGDSLGSYCFDSTAKQVTIHLRGNEYRCFRAYPGPMMDYQRYDPECSLNVLRSIGFTFDFTQGTCEYSPPGSMKIRKIRPENVMWSEKVYRSVTEALDKFYSNCLYCEKRKNKESAENTDTNSDEEPYEEEDIDCGMYCTANSCADEGCNLVYFNSAYVAPVLDTLKNDPEKYFSRTDYAIPGTDDTLHTRTVEIWFAADSTEREKFYHLTEIDYYDTMAEYHSLYAPVYSPLYKALFFVIYFPGAEANWWNIYKAKNGKIWDYAQIGYGL